MNKRLNQTKWRSLVTGVLLAVSASGIIAAPTFAAEYSEGLVGVPKTDRALLKDAGNTVTKDSATNTITYDFKGQEHTFTVTDHDGFATNTDAGNAAYIFNNIAEDGTYGTLHIYQQNTGRNDFANVTAFSADRGKVIVNSNLDITASSAYTSMGICASGGADLLINGNVKMRKDDANSPWGIITKNVHGNYGPGGATDGADKYTGARWQPTGFNVGNTRGNITVKGDVDVAVRGTAVKTDAYDAVKGVNPYDLATISLLGKSIRIITPFQEENTVEGFGTFIEPYYSLASYGGTVNVNVENMVAGDSKVEIVGNVISMKRLENGAVKANVYQDGRINLGLTTADSSWRGVIDNAGTAQAGEVNLWLQNGAQWIYENASRKDGLDYSHMPEYSQSSYDNYDGISHLTTLKGGKDATSAGIIKMVDTDNIEIGTAEGVTKVWYDHNDATPASMIGGDVKVLTAKTGAEMLLFTGNNGLDKGFDSADAAADKNKVSEVLNSLAQKLWYMAGDDNLKGTVSIAEGLTASSQSMKVGNITFSDGTNGTKQQGQGFYDYTPEQDTKVYETGAIIKSENIDETRESDINGLVTINVTEGQEGVVSKAPSALYVGVDVESPLVVDLQGHTLKLSTGGDASRYLATVYVDEGKSIEIKDSKNSGALKISTGVGEDGNADNKTNYTYGIYVDGGSLTASTDVEIDGVKSTSTSRASGIYAYNGNVEFAKDLTIKNVLNNNKVGPNTAGIYADASSSSTSPSNVVVKGKLNIENVAGAALRSMNGSTITTAGATIKAMDIANGTANSQYYAAFANKGTINLNTGDGITAGVLDVTGDLKVSNQSTSIINMNLTKDSQWTGAAYNVSSSTYNPPAGNINLTMAEGSVWNHETGRSVESLKTTFAGSNISKLNGSGLIYQKADKGITVYNYSGDTTVFYDHDKTDPLTIIGGDFTIKAAEAGSKITLVTDSQGIAAGFADSDTAAEKNNVKAVLNKLANKLFYTGYKDNNLTGYVKIAEGLTASSMVGAVKAAGDITFSDGTNGTKTAGQGFYDYTPEEDKPNYRTGPITGSEDISLSRETDAMGVAHVTGDTVPTASGFVSALYDGGSSSYSDPMTVKLGNKGLSLSATTDSGQAAGIYVGNNANINIIKSSADKVLSITATNEDTRAAHGMYVMGNAKLNITGPVELTNITTQGDVAAGISIQGQKSDVTIDGSLKINGISGKRERGLGINAAGISVTGDSSSVTVTGPVDISGVRGSGIKLIGADTKVSVGGGTITAAEDSGKSHNFYAARVEKGTLDINMKDGAAGSTTTKITGDMYVTGQYGKKVIEYSGGELIDWNDAGILNVALTDKDSFWKGVAAYDQYNSDYGSGGNTMHDIGQFNLYLQNGASWTNEQQSHATTTTIASKNPVWEGSTLATLAGGIDAAHSGYIFQKDSNPISVVNYSGYTTVFYNHDASDPTKMIGGDFKITNAAEGSNITLVTDNVGLTSGWNDSDAAEAKDLVSKTLDSLAGKLFYKSYTDGHLQGTVKIAEGLTSSSASLKVGNISFSTDVAGTGVAGQGYYDYKPRNPGSQTESEFTTAITGDAAVDTVYAEKGVLKDDGSYVFTQSDTTIKLSDPYIIGLGPYTPGGKGSAVISAADEAHKVIIDLKGNNLSVNNANSASITGISAIGKGVVEINNAGAMDITAESTTSGLAAALFANSGGIINIHNKDVLTLRAKSKNPAYAAVVKTMNGINGVTSSITIDGLVDILADKAEASGANEAISAVASKIEVGGGSIKAINGAAYAIRAYGEFASQNRATVNVNVKKDDEGKVIGAGDNKVELEGNVFLGGGMDGGGAKADVNVGLNTKDSYWKGDVGMENFANGSALGIFNLYMGNGASWTGNNISQNTVNASLTGGAVWTGYSTGTTMNLGLDDASIWNVTGNSKLKSFSGKDGSIVMSDASVDVADYSGSTTVIYKHDASDPTNIIGGSFTIGQAQDGASINFLTDNEGIASGYSVADKAEAQNQVSEVLNKLAQKLFYTANDGKLSGNVTIAEGLTASSKTLKTGNISFSTDATGTKTAGQGFYDYTPADDTVLTAKITGGNDAKYVNLGIEAEKGIYNFTQNTTINVTKGDYDFSLGAIESSSGPITINADGKALDVSYTVASGSNVARAVATSNSYSVKNKNISIKADKLNLSAATTGFRAQTVYAEGGTISIDADTTLSTSAQTESNGIYAGSEGVVNMNGNLTIKEDSNASKYYALKADYNGIINVNIKDDKAGDGVVKINSDIFTKSQESYDYGEDETTTTTSTVNMALKGADASWTGRHLYESKTSGDDTTSYGNFNLWLEDGASWTNEKTGKDISSGFAGSHVTSFVGGSDAAHAGNIFQKDSKNLTIDNYSGNTNIFYAHTGNGEAASDYAAGDTVIKSAAEGSVVSLITDSTDVAMDNAKSVANVLNALAGKLTYSNFTKGEKNISGYVKIADGLTASSKALQVGDITFTDSGKGSYIPDHQVITEFTTKLTGDKDTDQEYLMGGVIAADGTYKFTEASDITAVNAIDAAKDLKIVADKTLSVTADKGIALNVTNAAAKNVDITAEKLVLKTTSSNGAMNAGSSSAKATVNITGNVDINATNDLGVFGIYAANADITVKGDIKAEIDGGQGNWGSSAGASAISARGQAATRWNPNASSSNITVDGNVDIVGNGNGLQANGNGASVTINGGGTITVNDPNNIGYAALRADNGTVNMNVALADGKATAGLGKDVVLKGNLAATNGTGDTSASVINVALDTDKSSLEGVAHTATTNSSINMWLQNGASWINEIHGATEKYVAFTGSHVANFVGGTSDATAGSIFQKDSNNLTIDNYSGNTNIFYAHTGNGEAAENYTAGDTVIKSAAEGSVVSLITDSTDVAMDNEYSVKKVLNALAGKLTYSNFTNGEENLTGYVKIADGLTASSKSLQAGDISFSKDDGKGSFKEGTLNPGFTYPEEQPEDKKDLTQGITGDDEKDYVFKQNGILKEDGRFIFTQDPTEIKVADGAAVNAAIRDIDIDSSKAKLLLTGASEGVKTDGHSVNILGSMEISGETAISANNGDVTLNGITKITGENAAINAANGANVNISGGAATINGDLNADGATIKLDSGATTSEIKGDLNVANGGSIDIKLNEKNSTLTGGYDVEDGSIINLTIQNGATWNVGSMSGSGLNITGGASEGATGYIIMPSASSAATQSLRAAASKLNIASLSGWETIIYAHENAGTAVSDYTAGDTVIKTAEAGSGVILSTDNSGIDMTDKASVEATLKALAQKVTYSDYEANGSNLTGKVQIADGLTASSVRQNIGDITWTEEGVGQYVAGSVNMDDISEGDYETFVMKGVRSATTTSLHTWRDNMQDTYTGADLADADGIFAKVLGGKTSSDVKGVKDSNTYSGVQVGYDKALADDTHIGVAFDYRDGDSKYLLGGEGDNKLYSIGVYGVKRFADDSYLRVAAKAGRVENEYDVYTEGQLHKLHGDYKSNAYGLTMEYGKTFSKGDNYLTPKAQLTWAQVSGKDYSAYTESGARMDISQDTYQSFVGRLGLEAGMQNERGRVYAGLYAAHEFAGDITTNYFANDGKGKHTSFSGANSWMELTVGGSYDLSKVSHVYADFAKDFGGDFERKWKVNAGLRFEF